MNSTLITPPTYPARPVNGGPFEKALPKTGDWYYEPKYNGWRAWVHAPTRTMFNRHGELLSIAHTFDAVLNDIQARHNAEMPWLDVEALGRRHDIGRGSLIILDYLPSSPGTYKNRRSLLELACACWKWPLLKELNKPVPDNSIHLTMSYRAEGAPQLWEILKQCNAALGCEFYEGFVAKRADSLYPIQLRNPKLEFPFWIKHRWAF